MATTTVPYSGFNAVCTVGGVTIPGTDWTLSDDAKIKDCNNFRDGRLRVETLHDSNFSATLIWDVGANPSLSANGGLVAGATVAMSFKVADSKFFTGSFIISSVEVSNPGMEDVVMYKVTGVLSSAATQSFPLKSITYPNT